MLELSNDKKKEIINYLDNTLELADSPDKEQTLLRLKSYLDKYSGSKFSATLLGKIFLLVNPPDEDGFSKEITIQELSKYHPSFRTSNGGDWCRSHSSYLGKKYIIKRTLKNGKIYSVKLDGINKNLIINQSIRKDIINELSKKRCVILDIGNVEIDHKNGKKDEYHLNNLEEQSLDDFQPLSKAANDAKREHCKKCRSTKKRYDAKRLGYSESFTKGDFNTDNCQGCYWYDPIKFNQEISANFHKDK